MDKDKNEKKSTAEEAELKQKAEEELNALLKNDGYADATNLQLTDQQYRDLLDAIAERNRLSDFISDTICQACREKGLPK